MSQELTTDVQQKKSLLVSLAAKYGMDAEAFKNTIKSTVMPNNATNEQMAAFLLVAFQYDLNPITKEIYAFPARGGGVTPVVGIDGWINLAQRRHEFDGMEFDYTDDESGSPISCTCRVYRKDRTRPIIVTEYMSECRRATDPWKSHPRRMLRHKAAIQGIRYAFGFSGIRDEDDAEIIYAGEAQRVEDYASTASASIMSKARQKKATKQQSKRPKQVDEDIETIAEAEADPEPESPGSKPSGPRYEPQEGAGLNSEIRSAIEKATNTEDLADAEDMLRDGFEGPSDQHEELVRLVAVRRHKLMQIERG
jgi:phage recombination protein Bet